MGKPVRQPDGDTESPPISGIDTGWSIKTKLILGAVALVALGVTWIIGATVVPRWWAQRMGNLIDGRLTFGSLVGLTVGFVFTVIPLIMLRLGWRLRKGWGRAVITVVLAALVASPNLATLGIVMGSGNAAHAGERILDVDGPGFRGGSLIGAIVGAVVAAGIVYLMWSRLRNKNKAKKLKDELKAERG